MSCWAAGGFVSRSWSWLNSTYERWRPDKCSVWREHVPSDSPVPPTSPFPTAISAYRKRSQSTIVPLFFAHLVARARRQLALLAQVEQVALHLVVRELVGPTLVVARQPLHVRHVRLDGAQRVIAHLQVPHHPIP
jgi:hypothetical protein